MKGDLATPETIAQMNCTQVDRLIFSNKAVTLL